MGCWNGTCMVSKLPIFAGEAVRVILLKGTSSKLSTAFRTQDWVPGPKDTIDKDTPAEVKNSIRDLQQAANRWRDGWWGGFTYADTVFTPYNVPLKCKYNDYGSVTDIEETYFSEELLTRLRKEVMHFPAGDMNIPEALTKDFTLEEYFDQVERGAVSIGPMTTFVDGLSTAPLGMCMVREEVYQAITTEANKVCSAEDKNNYLDLLKVDPKDPMFYTVRMLAYRSISYKLTPLSMILTKIQMQVSTKERSLQDPTVVDTIDSIFEFLNFTVAMDAMRAAWMPQAGAGSQGYDTSFHKLVAEIVLDKKEGPQY